jgi:hypothetical protein
MVFLYVKIREWQACCRDFIHLYCEACRDMARRRQEIALQTEIETQEEWTEALNKEGLTGNGSSAFEWRYDMDMSLMHPELSTSQ